MKKTLLLGLSIVLFGSTALKAQNWVNGGNTLSGNGTIGTNSNHSLIFETYNTERGRITSTGLWGIGTGTTLPNSKFQINSATTVDPLRVQVNTLTKFLVHKSGGVAIGANIAPPANGLYVAGNIGVGVTAPNSRLHINSTTSQDPLRLQVNGSTKLFVHRSGGVSIGAAATPPTNGLLVNGKVGIGTTTLGERTMVEVLNSTIDGTGISASGELYGLVGYATNEYGNGVNGYGPIGVLGEGTTFGIYGEGEFSGVHSKGKYYGVYSTTDSGTGVYGYSDGYESPAAYGGYFSSWHGTGLYAGTDEGAYAAEFSGDTFTSGTNYQGSDKNIKKNIQEVDNAMNIINKLKPKYYEFRDDGKYAGLRLPKGNHYGLLAQDVEEVLPNLVKETSHEVRENKPMARMASSDKKSAMIAKSKEQNKPAEKVNIKAVNYNEFIPILIKAVQEQQSIIEQQNANIEKLTQLVNKLAQNPNTPVTPTSTYLSQSAPNPSKNSTRINYSLPTNTTKAELILFNSAGQKVRQIQLDNSGGIDINTSSLSAGTYSYSLYTDGNFVESRKLIVAR